MQPDPYLSAQNYEPQQGEAFFHYCSRASFWSICCSRSLWLSSVYALNDSLELAWGRQLVEELLSAHPIQFPRGFRSDMVEALREPHNHLLPLIASFSGTLDLLSQWRAYAEDGRGVAIAFDASLASSSLPVNMKRVLYDKAQQEAQLMATLELFLKYWWMWKLGSEAALGAIVEVLPDFAFDLVCLKHPSFFEEREVRMVHLVNRAGDWWSDSGGHSESAAKISGVMVQKRERDGLEIPYIALPLRDSAIITGLMLGPKNPESPADVRSRLESLGFGHVEVKKSTCPYR
jgi:DUF2971 family protein